MMKAKSDTNITKMKAAAYLRVSKEKQASEGYSLAVQNKMIEEYALKNGLILDEHFIFKEVSPASKIEQKNTNISLEDSLGKRPVLKELLDLAQQKQFKHLILLCHDRLARDFEQFLAIKFILNKNNIKIHYCKEGENLSSADEKINRFLDNILANVAELESNVISSRVKSGTSLRVDKGLWPGGKAPFGYELLDKYTKECRLKPLIEKKNEVQEVFNYYKMGYSYKQIAETMNEKYDVTIWKKSKVESIIKNKTYTGYIYWDRRGGRRHPGKHDEVVHSRIFNKHLCFIPEQEWDIIEQIRNDKVALKDPKYLDTPFLLKDKLICGKCGKKMVTKNYGMDKNGNERRVYKCPTTFNKESELIISKNIIEKLVLEQLKESFTLSNMDTQWILYQSSILEHQSKIKELLDDCHEKIKTIDHLRKNIGDIYKEELNIDILERIEFQDELLLKTKEKCEKDIISYQSSSSIKYISCKEEFEHVILGLIDSFFKIDTTLHQRRMLITLLIDNIVVSESGDMIKSINVNHYPYNLP